MKIFICYFFLSYSCCYNILLNTFCVKSYIHPDKSYYIYIQPDKVTTSTTILIKVIVTVILLDVAIVSIYKSYYMIYIQPDKTYLSYYIYIQPDKSYYIYIQPEKSCYIYIQPNKSYYIIYTIYTLVALLKSLSNISIFSCDSISSEKHKNDK